MVGFLSFVVCLVLSAGIGYSAYRRAQAKNTRGAVRLAAWALVPIGLDLAGFVRLGRKVGDAVGHWALNLVFDPLVWIGLLMLGVAALVLVVAGFGGTDAADEPEAIVSKSRRAVGPSRQKAPAPSGEDSEIEAILRKHGVS